MPHPTSKVALVTGGASGIGRGLAERLIARGSRVVLADVHADRVADAARSLGCAGIRLDVRDPEAVRAAVESIEREHGPIDLLVNSAGIVRAGDTHLFDLDDWRQVIDVNLYGVVHTIHAVYPGMVARRRGRILNIASIAGLFPSAGQVSYVASKTALVGLSHALRAEASGHGVSVCVACPGVIDTPMTEGLVVKSPNAARVKALVPRGLDVGTCCDVILRGLDRDEATILVGGLAHALAALQRLCPRLAAAVNTLGVRWLTR